MLESSVIILLAGWSETFTQLPSTHYRDPTFETAKCILIPTTHQPICTLKQCLFGPIASRFATSGVSASSLAQLCFERYQQRLDENKRVISCKCQIKSDTRDQRRGLVLALVLAACLLFWYRQEWQLLPLLLPLAVAVVLINQAKR